MIAVATAAGEIRVYKVADRTRIATIPWRRSPFTALRSMTTELRVAVGSKAGLVSIYGLPAGKIIKSLTPVPVVGAH